ncbi:MAG: general secretion pathway protein A [Hyphomicrobiaceae bacterium]|jgi:general secretion pathway protein A
MYAHFYQLSEEPFNLTPDPKYHYVNETTREALASVLYGIRSRKGFLSLIGEAGCGKTTLLKRVLEELEGDTRVVFVFNPAVSFDELLEYICIELGVRTDGRGRLHLLERLNAFLLDQLTQGRNVVVMIDEAQTLDDKVLEELRLLSNLETSKEKILQILLSGQPELDEKLRRPQLRQLRQRIGVRASLRPMRADEIDAYIQTRLRSAGAPRADLFTPAALRRVWQVAEGIPRVVNVLCDNAMMIAFADGKDRISVKVMGQAIRDLHGETPVQAWLGQVKGWLVAPAGRYATAAFLLAAVAIPVTFALRGDPTTWVAQDAPAEPVVVASSSLPPEVAESAGAPGAVVEGAPVPVAAPEIPVAVPVEAAAAPIAGSAGLEARKTEPVATQVAGPQALPDPLLSLPNPLHATQEPALDASGMPPINIDDSVRRAEVLARSAAARLFDPDFDAAVVRSAEVELPESARIHTRSEDEAKAMAESVLGRRRPAAVPEAAPVVAAPTPPVVPEPAGDSRLAALAEVPQPPASPAARPAPRPGDAIVGRFARVARGDTLWAITLQYYGSVDTDSLTGILSHNAEIKEPNSLTVGSYLFLPFLSADQMVRRASSGEYEVLLAESPDVATVERAAVWAEAALPGHRLRTVTKGSRNPVRMLYAVGYASRASALEAARSALGRFHAGRG